MTEDQRHATIIGAGIIGVSAAAFLQRAGFRVTLIDRLPPGEGCSFGNAGGIAFSEVVPSIHPGMLLKIPGWLVNPLGPLAIRWSYLPKALPWFLAAARNATPARVAQITEARARLGLRAVKDLETLLHSAGERDLLVYEDTLRLYDTMGQFEAEADERAAKVRHGYNMTRLSAQEIVEIEPDLAKDFACGAFHGGWYFVRDPERVVKAIARDVARQGGEILQDDVVSYDVAEARVTSLQLASGRVHKLDRLVICAGVYSAKIARQFGDKVILEAERGYHMTIKEPGVRLKRSITMARTPGAATPMDMGLRLAGTDEFAGINAPPNWARADALWTHFKRALPHLQAPSETTTRWMGRRPGTPDSLPVIGPSKHMQNVWYGFGHGHMGLTWGPSTGRMLGEIMNGAPSNQDLSAFRVDRF